MDEKELYKFRAEDFAKNFENLRTMEWQVVFQLYAGYSLLGAAYWALANDENSGGNVYPWVFIAAIVLLFWAAYFLGLRIHQSQDFSRRMQNAYLAKLHDILKVDQLENLPDVRKPKLQHWYAFWIQTILSAAFALGLIVFILKTM